MRLMAIIVSGSVSHNKAMHLHVHLYGYQNILSSKIAVIDLLLKGKSSTSTSVISILSSKSYFNVGTHSNYPMRLFCVMILEKSGIVM